MTSRWAAATAAAVTLGMLVVYLVIMSQEDDQPAAWFVAGLALAGLLCLYGVGGALPGRRWALITSAVLLLALGLLGILSIGLPIIGAGVLALLAARRPRRSTVA